MSAEGLTRVQKAAVLLARSKPIAFGLFETGNKRLQGTEANETGSSSLKRINEKYSIKES